MNNIRQRHYSGIPGITPDYFKVRDFLICSGRHDYTYARWDWMTTHPNLSRDSLSRIGLWEDGGRVVALAVFDCQPDDAYLLTFPGYEYLLSDMIGYAEHMLNVNDEYRLVIPDTDHTYQALAAVRGYIPTPDREYTAAFYPEQGETLSKLPDGFYITDMHETFDLYQYGRVLWNGFNHEQDGEGAYAPEDEDVKDGRASMLRPNVDLTLKIAVVAPNGNFAAYCGMWYDTRAGFAVIEPVACDPAFRRMGLGRAAVLEGIGRVVGRGAKLAVVGSSQQFYYSIGLRPYLTGTRWKHGRI